MRTSTIMTTENKQVIDSKGPLKNGFESQKRKDEIHAYKIKALKDREYRNKLQILEREARLTLAQSKLSKESPAPTADANPECQRAAES